MAIRIIRICDDCKGVYDQILDKSAEVYTYAKAFVCRECDLKRMESIPLPQSLYKCYLCGRDVYTESDSYDYWVTCKNGPRRENICTFCKETIEKQNREKKNEPM